MGLVGLALRLPHTFYVLAVLTVLLGVTGMVLMPTDIFPEINIPVVTVIWQIYRTEHAGNGTARYDLRGMLTVVERQRDTGHRGAGERWSSKGHSLPLRWPMPAGAPPSLPCCLTTMHSPPWRSTRAA